MSPPNLSYEGIKIGDKLPASYIVILKPDTSDDAFKEHRDRVCSMCSVPTTRGNIESPAEPYDYIYNLGSMKGYCGTFTQTIIDQIASDPNVEYVEQNSVIGLPEEENAPEVSEYNPDEYTWTTEDYSINEEAVGGRSFTPFQDRQKSVQRPIYSWGLGAISHRSGTGNSYVFDQTAGEGVTTFVFDTGIRITHRDFQGRAKFGHNFAVNSTDTEVQGHGTHVAGTVAGYYFGVAKRANVVSVKVICDNGYGEVAAFLKAVELTVAYAKKLPKASVINASIGFGANRTVDDAVAYAVKEGVVFVAAAGNDGYEADSLSPARAGYAFTVGATTMNGDRWRDSNFGRWLNIFAPGDEINSCGIANDMAQKKDSGTSMAAPHVSGVAACLIVQFGLRTPKEINSKLVYFGTRGTVGNAGAGSPNLFLYNGMSS